MKIFYSLPILLFLHSISLCQSQSNSYEFLLTLLSADGITSDEETKSYKSIYDEMLTNARDEIADEENIYEKHEALFKLLHDNYLKKYVEESYINRLFKGKEFNCVTSVALYKMICTDLDLSLNLYESPYHVYITVNDSKKSEFTIELTDPVDGFDPEEDNSDFVQYLVDYKLITQEELNEKGEEQVYKDYMSETHLISADNLASIYFANLASYNLSKDKTYEAYKLIKKALLIASDSTKIETHNRIWRSHVNDIKNEPERLSSFLLESIDSIPSSEEFRDYLINISPLAIETNLLKNNFETADKIYEKLCSILPQEKLSNNILSDMGVVIELNKLRSLSMRGEYEDAFLLAGSLFNKHRDNQTVLDFYLYAGNTYIQNLALSGDYNKLMEVADTLFTNAPGIKSVETAYASACVVFVANSGLYTTDTKKAEKMLLDAYSKLPDNIVLKKGLGLIYHELAMAEIRNRNNKKAVDLLNEGLKYDPENSDLKRELKLTNDLLPKK